jgi:hypothetical protein
MEEYKYIPELKAALVQYGKLRSEISRLEEKETLIRSQIENWLKNNKLSHFEVEDSTDQIWKIAKTGQARNKVLDYEAVKRALPEAYKNLIVKNEIEVFSIRKLNEFSNEWMLKSNTITD